MNNPSPILKTLERIREHSYEIDKGNFFEFVDCNICADQECEAA